MKRILGINIFITIFVTIYVFFRLDFLNEQIPLWTNRPWGKSQLADKNLLFLIPIIMSFTTAIAFFLGFHIKKKFLRYGNEIIWSITTGTNLILSYSALRIVQIASSPFPAIVPPVYLSLTLPFAFAAIVVTLVAPNLIEKLKDNGIVTDPSIHKHPGMLLTKPSVRGGGIIFTLGVLISSVFFVKLSQIPLGIIFSMTLGALLGLADDIQNTKPKTNSLLKKLENPWIRLLIQAIIILPIILAGIQITEISNPLNGLLKLDFFKFSFAGSEIYPIPIIFTLLWMLWIMNLLSWSNGVDGQYSGIISIAAIIIAIITLREPHLSFDQRNTINLAAIVAGASIGLLPYTWSPSKIMWGFGAISAGIAIASISVLIKAKIAAALIVLAIPFLDGVITVTRRIIQKKSPVKNDRGHLHHLLLDMGWPVKKVAVFYWITTIITGYIGIISADKNPMLSALIVAGIIAFIIAMINILYFKKKKSW